MFPAKSRWGIDPATQRIGSQRPTTIGQVSEGPETLASRTGGFTIRYTNDLAGGVQRVFAENRDYYLPGYRSSNPKRDGRFRKIELQVQREGRKVRARKGYYAPREDD